MITRLSPKKLSVSQHALHLCAELPGISHAVVGVLDHSLRIHQQGRGQREHPEAFRLLWFQVCVNLLDRHGGAELRLDLLQETPLRRTGGAVVAPKVQHGRTPRSARSCLAAGPAQMPPLADGIGAEPQRDQQRGQQHAFEHRVTLSGSGCAGTQARPAD